MNIVNKIIIDSKIADLRVRFAIVKEAVSDMELYNSIERLEQQLEEELSSGDWTRIGIATGLLWYKLDALIDQMKDSNGTLRAMLDELRKRR